MYQLLSCITISAGVIILVAADHFAKAALVTTKFPERCTGCEASPVAGGTKSNELAVVSQGSSLFLQDWWLTVPLMLLCTKTLS